jgi:hypothetical protein
VGRIAVTYEAWAALANGGFGVGCYINNGVQVQSAGLAFGRTFMEDITQSQRDPERQIYLDWEQNKGRFS